MISWPFAELPVEWLKHCISVPFSGNASATIRQVESCLANRPYEQRHLIVASMTSHFTRNVTETALHNFVLSVIKAEVRDPEQPLDVEDTRILAAGRYRLEDSEIRFRMPGELLRRIAV